MEIIAICLGLVIAVIASGQDAVNIAIPPGVSWLLTGGGLGQDDAPAPFLPARAIVQNYASSATIRIMDGANVQQLRSFPLAAETTTQVIVNPGERLIIDADQGATEISVSYADPLMPFVIRNRASSPLKIELSDGRQFDAPAKQDIALKARPGTYLKVNGLVIGRVLDASSGAGQVMELYFP